jgi:hypothetical protein
MQIVKCSSAVLFQVFPGLRISLDSPDRLRSLFFWHLLQTPYATTLFLSILPQELNCFGSLIASNEGQRKSMIV